MRYWCVFLAILFGAALAWLYTPDKRRAELEAVYARPPSQFIEIAGIRLHLRDTGPKSAPALIFLHGFGSSLQTWDDWAHDLEADHRVIRYDLPGFGLTGADPTGDYSDRRSIAVLLALMDRWAYCVHPSSATRWGAASPGPSRRSMRNRTDKLVLISPDGFASPGLDYGVTSKAPLMIRALPYVSAVVYASGLAGAGLRNRGSHDRRAVHALSGHDAAPGVRRAIVDRMNQMALVDPVPLLKAIEAPTLLMWGEKDGMIPFANSADYLRALPNATLAALPGVGHIPQEEAPTTVTIFGSSWSDSRALGSISPATLQPSEGK